jgi:hypothetical protein
MFSAIHTAIISGDERRSAGAPSSRTDARGSTGASNEAAATGFPVIRESTAAASSWLPVRAR